MSLLFVDLLLNIKAAVRSTVSLPGKSLNGNSSTEGVPLKAVISVC